MKNGHAAWAQYLAAHTTTQMMFILHVVNRHAGLNCYNSSMTHSPVECDLMQWL